MQVLSGQDSGPFERSSADRNSALVVDSVRTMVKSELHLLRVLFRNYICCAFYLGFCVRNLIELGGATTEGDFRSVVILIVQQCIFLPLPRGVIYGFNLSYHVYLVFLCPFFLFRFMPFVGYLVSTTTF